MSGFSRPGPRYGQVYGTTIYRKTLSRYRKKQQKDTATLIIAGMRALWLERNARVFEGKEKSMNMLISNV